MKTEGHSTSDVLTGVLGPPYIFIGLSSEEAEFSYDDYIIRLRRSGS